MKNCTHCGDAMKQRFTPAGAKRGWVCARCNHARANAYRFAEPEKYRDTRLWTTRRIRSADYDALLESQGGACACCGEVPPAFVIDHDHACCPGEYKSCGKCTRGLICQPCNLTVGHAHEDIKRLRAAADYLERLSG